MKKIIFVLLFFLMTNNFYCQTKTGLENNNLNFDKVENGKPVNWESFGSSDYLVSVDSTDVESGKYSGVIEYHGDNPEYKAVSYSIPEIYEGKKIKLTGYLKTENVTGSASLWMRIDPLVAFDNMQNRPVKGTSGWTKYEITLDLQSSKAKTIVVGGLLTGKGKMWIDNLQISIDEKALADVPEKALLPAEKDKEFDKGSKINAIVLNDEKINDLKTLGLVWGFLKYYHPNVAKGNFNWDYELFRILPSVLKSKNHGERDSMLSNWIETLGSFDLNNNEADVTKRGTIKPDLDWIQQSNFSKTLTDELIKVENAKRVGNSYYISMMPGVGNPEFDHEDSYSAMKYPDAGFRVLSLFSYWNKIQYFFPYKDLIKEDWKDVLKEFIPKFVNAANETEYKLAALELIGRIHDTHANIYGKDEALNKYFGTHYSPVEITFIDNKPIVTGYYNETSGKASGMKRGDEIISINDKPVEAIIKDQLKYTPASNYPTQLRNLSRNLLRSNDSTIQIEYKRDSKINSATVKTYSADSINRYKNLSKNDTCFKLIDNNIAYLYPGTIKQSYLPSIAKDLQNTRGLIIDMRCYPKEFIVFSFGKYLMPISTPFVKFTTGSIVNPGLFTMSEPLSVGERNMSFYNRKVVILINETTQSQAEYTTMAFRAAPKVTVIGSTTAGADGNVSPIYLVGDIRTMISGIGVFYPDGKGTQRVGIVPDMVVEPTIEGIKKGKDEVLEKAIQIINKK